MLCDVCQSKDANVFFTQIVNGQVQKVNLCEECSKQKGVTDPTGFALAELLLGMGTTQEKTESKPAGLTCPSCGYSQAEFKRVGRLGCPRCYDTFRSDVETVLGNLHKGTRHTGKVPANALASALGNRLESLRRELAKAIDEEQFEEAVRLRDEINSLTPPIGGSRQSN
ncbi:MAG: UvrB/UvrC motif-containing protein [Verrucomicrobiales bacterium]